MRKIEKEMLNALKCGRNYRKGNTIVSVRNTMKGRHCSIYLHGNAIFSMFQPISGGKAMKIFTLAGWNTRTTRSRLNSLGITIKQKKGVLFWDNKEICADELYMF